jgi:hypothetical protein
MIQRRKLTGSTAETNPSVLLIASLLTVGLVGCNTIGGFAGAAAGIASGTATTNPAVGYGVSVGVAVAVDATTQYIFRTWHQAEQDQIAAQIGRLKPGVIAPWKIQHPVPYENEHGEVEVVRILSSPLAICKEALFSVVSDEGGKRTRQWFVVTACRQDNAWKWAVAEPAVARWGSLQ